MFQAGIYRGNGSDRARWGVYCTASRTWYFSKRYGERAARQYAERMNRTAR